EPELLQRSDFSVAVMVYARVGDDRHAPHPADEGDTFGRADALAGEVRRRIGAEELVEGLVEVANIPAGDHGAGDVWPADELVGGELANLCFGEAHAELGETRENSREVPQPLRAESEQLLLKGAIAGIDEKAEDMDLATFVVAGDLATRENLDA